jgi:hypothetical protein
MITSRRARALTATFGGALLFLVLHVLFQDSALRPLKWLSFPIAIGLHFLLGRFREDPEDAA